MVWGAISRLSENANSQFGTQKVANPIIEPFSEARLREHIDNGNPVILRVLGPFGTHWPLVIGYTDDDFIIHDPAFPDPPAGQHMTLASQSYIPHPNDPRMIVYEKTNSDFTSLEIHSPAPVQFLITDGLGNKPGFDPQTGITHEDIHGGSYFFSSAYGDPTVQSPVPPAAAGEYVAFLNLPQSGDYSIQVVGDVGEEYAYRCVCIRQRGELKLWGIGRST